MQKLWVGTEDEGCSVLIRRHRSLAGLVHVIQLPSLIYVRKINGNIWIGYFKNGLDIISPSMKITHYSSFELGLREESIYAFVKITRVPSGSVMVEEYTGRRKGRCVLRE